MSNPSSRSKYKTGVSLEPEVVRSLDELASQIGLPRSWVVNTIVRQYLRLWGEYPMLPLFQREGVIEIN